MEQIILEMQIGNFHLLTIDTWEQMLIENKGSIFRCVLNYWPLSNLNDNISKLRLQSMIPSPSNDHYFLLNTQRKLILTLKTFLLFFIIFQNDHSIKIGSSDVMSIKEFFLLCSSVIKIKTLDHHCNCQWNSTEWKMTKTNGKLPSRIMIELDVTIVNARTPNLYV